MKESKKSKKMIVIVLLVFVIALGVGFAAFSTTLKINGSAKVKPKAENFKVHFASAPIGSDNLKSVIEPSSVSEGADGSSANISELEFSDAVATFSENGQTVKYDFYVVNEGKYDAYLTNVDFESLNEEGKFKVCDYVSDSQLAVDACKGIYVLVKIGEGDEQITLKDTGTVSNHKLEVNESEPVSVIVSYASSAVLSDEEFEVAFGNIDLTFRTTDEKEEVFGTSSLYGAPLLIGNNEIEIGTEFTIGTEHFYVIEVDDENDTVTGLAKYNLMVGTSNDKDNGFVIEDPDNNVDYGRQSSKSFGRLEGSNYYYGVLEYGGSSYWIDFSKKTDDKTADEFISEDGTKPFVYNEKSSLYVYLEGGSFAYAIGPDNVIEFDIPGYHSYLDSMLVGKVEKVSLMSYEQFIKMKFEYGNPEWLEYSSYWLGSATGEITAAHNGLLYAVKNYSGDNCSYTSDRVCSEMLQWSTYQGLRPTVTIKKELFNELD